MKHHLTKLLFCSAFLMLGTISACAQMSKHEGNRIWLDKIRVAEQTTFLLNDLDGVLPLKDIENKKIASVSLGTHLSPIFDSIASKYSAIHRVSSANLLREQGGETTLKAYNTLIVQLNDASLSEAATLPFLLKNAKNKQLLLVFYGDENGLTQLDSVPAPVIWSKQETPESAQFVAQAIFGGVALTAQLDPAISFKHKQHKSFTSNVIRLGYTVPEALGIHTEDLEEPIDAIMQEAIAQRATPGGVVLVAKDGKVIFNKAYGYHTYDNLEADKVTDIFDLASITKISATTMAAMRLYEQNKLILDAPLGSYLPEARNTNKNAIPVRDLMLHQAGLISYIPFYQNIRPEDCDRDSTGKCSVKISDNYYLRKGYYQEVMWPQMLRSRLQTPGKYVYSDLSMYMMKEIIERQAAQSLSEYTFNEFYKPLGMSTAGFNPRSRFPKEQIVPTEQDNYFRMALLQGFVHDQGAAMAGGVSGHAGMFSNANDLAILFQMMLNKGTYGGVQYFKPETIAMFTSRQSSVSRRGLGFDRWDPEKSKKYPSGLASPQTYGHTGFTGTCVWVDPKYNLIYVFLSNRVNSPGGNKLSSLSIRPRIQDAIYRAVLKSEALN